jgi:ATP-dependent DNA helicase RecG
MANKILSIDPKLNKLPELREEIEKLRIDEAARFMDKS